MYKTSGVKSNFLGIENKFSSFEKSKIAIVPIPYERTVSYGEGTKHGPKAILDASHFVEFFDEETGCEIHKKYGIATLEPLKLKGEGESKVLEHIYEVTGNLIKKNKFVIALGGEHTLSQATIAAFAEKYHDLSVIQVDAHSDLRTEYQGSKFSHASVMARICEFIYPRNIVQVGVRAQCIEEAEFIREKGITTLYAHEIRVGKFTKVLKLWQEYAIDKLTHNVYLTFDVDGFDPSIMPATGTPEPNGLFWHETMTLLRKLGRRKNVVGCDVVELSPIKGLNHPNITAAKLVLKMANYFVNK